MPKISGLPPIATPSDDDVIAIVDDDAMTTKKWSIANLKTYLQAQLLPSRTRNSDMFFRADGTGGTSSGNSEAPDERMTGTVTGYIRGQVRVPLDYQDGTDIVIKMMGFSSATNNSLTLRKYIGCHTAEDARDPWNVTGVADTSVTHSWTTDITHEKEIHTIDASFITAGDLITFAIRYDTAVSGIIHIQSVTIEYTADS